MIIDLGSHSTKIGKGNKVQTFATSVAVDQRTGEIVEFGESARRLIDRAPDHLDLVEPVSRGLVTDLELAARYLELLWKRMGPLSGLLNGRLKVLTSARLSRLDRNVLNEALPTSGSVDFVPKGLAGAVAADWDPDRSEAVCVIDFGADTTEVSVYAKRRVIRSEGAFVGSNDLTQAIKTRASSELGVDFSWGQAETLKKDFFHLESFDEQPRNLQITARDRVTGLPVEVEVTTKSLQEWAEPVLEKQRNVLRSALAELTPRAAADLYREGLILTGGGALQTGVREFVHRSVGVKSKVAKSAISAATEGARKL